MESKKHIIPIAFIISLIALCAVITFTTHRQLQRAKTTITNEVKNILEKSIIENAQKNTKNMFISATINQNPELVGTYEQRICRLADTTITYQYQIRDAFTSLFHEQQIYLLLTNRIESSLIQQEFDSLLCREQINAQTAIKIIASGHLKELTSYSGDTITMNIDGYANYTMDGGLEKIQYIAYLDYSFFTLWRLIPKQPLYIAFILIIIGAGFTFFNLLKVKKKIFYTETIIAEELPIVASSISFVKEWLEIQDEYVKFKGVNRKLAPQSLQILQLFLDANQHRISKKQLRELWPQKSNTLNNMTSAVNRLNRSLTQIECPFIIITDIEDKDYYILTNLQPSNIRRTI